MDHSLLKNQVYLFLLAYYNNKTMPNYSALSKQIGITRQTVSAKVKKLLNDKIIIVDQNNIVNVVNDMGLDEIVLKNFLDQNPNITAVELEKIFFNSGNIEAISNLNISESSYYAIKENAEVVVYGIVSEGVIKYIGSTKEYSERIKQHIRKRPFLTESNFIILVAISDNSKLTYEKQLIKLLQPEWNIMSK